MSDLYLEKFREDLEQIDEKLIFLLSDRFKIIQEIAQHKKEYNLDIKQPKQLDKVFERVSKLAEKYNLNQDLVKSIYTEIVKEAWKVQQDIIQN